MKQKPPDHASKARKHVVGNTIIIYQNLIVYKYVNIYMYIYVARITKRYYSKI